MRPSRLTPLIARNPSPRPVRHLKPATRLRSSGPSPQAHSLGRRWRTVPAVTPEITQASTATTTA